ncbi:MAG: hypothetical protein LQ350_006670 [Teloschistes chrysophthalmus]|nr:MAG: hypothetical protein LQ350_006670 [Niorma chrysophthalma]
MSRNYRIVSFLFLFFLTLINATPHPQFNGNRHRHAAAVTTVVAASVTTVIQGNGNANTNGNSNNNEETSTLQNNPNPTGSGNTPLMTDTPTTGTGNGKRGLAYNSSSPSLSVFANTDITWVHDWNSDPLDAPSQFLFVPTLWSDQSPHSDNWASLAAGHQYLMSFNEPDNTGQANMKVADALTAYKRLMMPQRKSGVKISAPSVSSGSGNNEAGIPMGTGWLSSFLEGCNDDTCQADFVSGHWYGCPSGTCTVSADLTSFQNYVTSLISTAAGRDVWIPEFQRYGDVDQQKQFVQQALPFLDGKGEVKRYAYYMVADGILTEGGGGVSALGAAYAG